MRMQYAVERIEIVESQSPDVKGLYMKLRDTDSYITAWVLDKELARLHGWIHRTLNLENRQLDDLAGLADIGPEGRVDWS